MKNRIAQLVDGALEQLPELQDAPELTSTTTTVERTRDPRNGDFATNIAMRLAKSVGMNPRELATRIIAALPENTLIDKVELAGPGFINFFVGNVAFQEEIAKIIEDGENCGRQPQRDAPRILLEFVSANPTQAVRKSRMPLRRHNAMTSLNGCPTDMTLSLEKEECISPVVKNNEFRLHGQF